MPRVTPSVVIEFASQKLGAATRVDRSNLHAMTALLQLVDEIPDALLRLEPREYGDFLECLGGLKDAIGMVSSQDRPGRISTNGDGSDALTRLRELLQKCPDEVASGHGSCLAFVADDELRDDLDADIASIEMAIAGGRWKIVNVLAGSVIEALLYWLIKEAANRHSKSLPPGLNQMSLGELNKIALDYGLVTREIFGEIDRSKDYRNLIHPGRSERLQQKCTRGTAHIVFGGLNRLIEHLDANEPRV